MSLFWLHAINIKHPILFLSNSWFPVSVNGTLNYVCAMKMVSLDFRRLLQGMPVVFVDSTTPALLSLSFKYNGIEPNNAIYQMPLPAFFYFNFVLGGTRVKSARLKRRKKSYYL